MVEKQTECKVLTRTHMLSGLKEEANDRTRGSEYLVSVIADATPLDRLSSRDPPSPPSVSEHVLDSLFLGVGWSLFTRFLFFSFDIRVPAHWEDESHDGHGASNKLRHVCNMVCGEFSSSHTADTLSSQSGASSAR
ncbi:hypothetical protein KGM_206508 [Danaus plexippus plexippus]|uniref:Uncharacterized protein n=1 Tax=Danaus plexippus plexippus TaxID=278856 RepID=A0A212F189_DANPL|nr:hypothetical protein KGM_206508 [Danaus plexippus plexippus]